ncbi:MAG: hypothetical protein M3348_16750 [Acidobacteriota bacterium]|nr:hypothetical protein [Acidobacteriota bacterium]
MQATRAKKNGDDVEEAARRADAEEADENAVTRIIRSYVRVFSLAVFFGSALLLMFVVTQESEQANATVPQLFWKIGEEILKGLLAASAVAFLYDWVLKSATEREMRDTIRKEVSFLKGMDEKFASARMSLDNLCEDLRVIKFRSGGDEPEAQTAYLKEFIMTRLPAGFLAANQSNYYHLGVHARFRTCYFGDKVRFVLAEIGRTNDTSADDLIFYWQIGEWPSKTLEEKWLEVASLRVAGEAWTQVRRAVEDGTIVAEFQKPASSKPPHGRIVTYEYDVKIVDNLVSPADLTLYIDYKIVRPTIRVDARLLGTKAVTPSLSPTLNALTSKYINAPEGDGTCEVFIEDEVARGATLKFTIKGHSIP